MKWNEVSALRLIYFLVFCCTAAWLPVMADFLRDQDLSPLRISLLLSLTPLLMLLVQPFYGLMADKWGYRRTLQTSCLLASICFAAFLLNGGFFYLVFISIAMSVFYNGLQPLLDSLSLQVASRDPRFSYGKLRIAGAAGWAFTGIITGQLIDVLSTTVIFSVAAISLFIAFFVSFALPGNDIANQRSEFKESLNEAEELKEADISGRTRLRHVLSKTSLWILLIAVLLISAGTSPIWYFYSTYLKELGASSGWVGICLSFQGLCELPLFYFSAAIIARLGYRTALLFTVGCSVLRLLLYSFTSNPFAVLPIELLHGFSWSLFWVVSVELVNQLVEPRYRATGQSLLYAAYFGAGVIIGNFWTGFLADANWGMPRVFSINAFIILAVGIMLAILLKQTKKPPSMA
jgi:PPP family 3-phenylpropionic acid transporter